MNNKVRFCFGQKKKERKNNKDSAIGKKKKKNVKCQDLYLNKV